MPLVNVPAAAGPSLGPVGGAARVGGGCGGCGGGGGSGGGGVGGEGERGAVERAVLAVDWTCSTNFVDAGQLTQQRTKVQMEMLALSRLTGRLVSAVLTDLTTGMRV